MSDGEEEDFYHLYDHEVDNIVSDEVDYVSTAEYQRSVYGPENFNRLLDRLNEEIGRNEELSRELAEKDKIIDELTKEKKNEH